MLLLAHFFFFLITHQILKKIQIINYIQNFKIFQNELKKYNKKLKALFKLLIYSNSIIKM